MSTWTGNGCAPVFGRGRTRRGDCARRGPANVAEPVLMRKARNRFREYDTRRDAAFHHQIAESTADIVRIDLRVRHDFVPTNR